MLKQIFNRQNLPWILTVVFALALVVVLFAKIGGDASRGNEINGVVQDSSGKRVTAWVDPMYSQGPPHTTRSNKPGHAVDCGMRLVPVYADEASSGSGPAPSTVKGYSNVSLSPQRQQLIGVKLGMAGIRDLSRVARTVGIVAVNETRRAQIHTKFEGYVEQLYVNFTGEVVRRGQPLLSIYSPDLLATENDLLLASRARKQFGNTLYDAAKKRLLLWDVAPAEIDEVERSGKLLRAVTLRSPVDGVVLTKTVVQGARVMSGDALYDLADLREVWVLADVYESELPYVGLGQSAQVTLSSFPGRVWQGRVSFITPVIDPSTRTAKVRIALANADGALRPDMFANVALEEPIGRVLTVPESAVLQTGTRALVFVALGHGQFAPRQVQTGVHAGGFYEIRQGLSAGETVVAEANFLVDSESRLKSAIANMGSAGGGGMANMPGMEAPTGGAPAGSSAPATGAAKQ